MNKIIAFGDIHGNLPALEAVLAESLRLGVTGFVCTGDVMGVLGWPNRTAKLVRDMSNVCVYGNHDAYFREDFSWYPEHPSQKQEHRVVTEATDDCVYEWLNGLPEESRPIFGDTQFHVVHGNPFAEQLLDKKWGSHKCGYPATGYCNKRDYPKVASFVDADYVVLGHTHRQSLVDCSKFGHDTIVVNPGSVGAPYDEPAEFAVIDVDAGEVELRGVEYDYSVIDERFAELDITKDGDYP